MKTISILSGLLLFISSAFCQTDKTLTAFTQSYQLESKGDYSGAIKTLKTVYDERSYETNLRLGWLYYEAGSYSESITYYERAINLMPYSIEAKLGYIYPQTALGNMDKVIAQYKKILETDPQNSIVNYRLGNIYYTKKDYQSALKYFEKVVNQYPFGYDGLIMFAWSHFQLGKMREAKVLFTKVLLLSPGDKSATEGLGLIK